MDHSELRSHSFVVKVWLEEPASGCRCGQWRGQVTHVSSRRRASLSDLGAIGTFVAPYLEELGVRTGRRCQIRQWFDRARPTRR